jgi:hypothetical protein
MRGAAMVLVILQHCYHLIDTATVSPIVTELLYLTTKIASVAFMAVSGMMIGFFFFSTPDWLGLYRRFARRALLLILVAHSGIQLARYFYFGPDHSAMLIHNILFDYPITDTIAVALLVTPLLLKYTTTFTRAVLAACLVVFSTVVVIIFQPVTSAGEILKAMLFGGASVPGIPFWGWPIIPWVGIFFSGSLVGPSLAEVRSGRMSPAALIGEMRIIAVYLMIIGVLLTVGYKLVKVAFGSGLPQAVYDAIYPSRTTGLLPVYLAILLLFLAFLMNRIEINGKYARVEWCLSVFGRTSLFTYVTQFIFVHSVPGIFGLQGKMNFLQYVLLFVFGLTASWTLSYLYGRLRGWITADDFAVLSGS